MCHVGVGRGSDLVGRLLDPVLAERGQPGLDRGAHDRDAEALGDGHHPEAAVGLAAGCFGAGLAGGPAGGRIAPGSGCGVSAGSSIGSIGQA